MYLAGDSFFFIYEAQDYLKTPVLLLFGPMGGIFPAHSHYVYFFFIKLYPITETWSDIEVL